MIASVANSVQSVIFQFTDKEAISSRCGLHDSLSGRAGRLHNYDFHPGACACP